MLGTGLCTTCGCLCFQFSCDCGR